MSWVLKPWLESVREWRKNIYPDTCTKMEVYTCWWNGSYCLCNPKPQWNHSQHMGRSCLVSAGGLCWQAVSSCKHVVASFHISWSLISKYSNFAFLSLNHTGTIANFPWVHLESLARLSPCQQHSFTQDFTQGFFYNYKACQVMSVQGVSKTFNWE